MLINVVSFFRGRTIVLLVHIQALYYTYHHTFYCTSLSVQQYCSCKAAVKSFYSEWKWIMFKLAVKCDLLYFICLYISLPGWGNLSCFSEVIVMEARHVLTCPRLLQLHDYADAHLHVAMPCKRYVRCLGNGWGFVLFILFPRTDGTWGNRSWCLLVTRTSRLIHHTWLHHHHLEDKIMSWNVSQVKVV